MWLALLKVDRERTCAGSGKNKECAAFFQSEKTHHCEAILMGPTNLENGDLVAVGGVAHIKIYL